MPFTIKVKVELSDEFLSDVLITAVESGYDSLFYWDGVRMMTVDRNDDLSINEIDFFACDGDGERQRFNLTHEDVGNAIQAILDGSVKLGYPLEYIQRAVREHDAGDIDATAADCIIQAACFGEVVYG